MRCVQWNGPAVTMSWDVCSSKLACTHAFDDLRNCSSCEIKITMNSCEYLGTS